MEAVNKIIKFHLKTRLENLNSAWVKELPVMLWTYLTSVRTSTRNTHFSLAFGTDIVASVEVGLNIQRIICYRYEENQEFLELDKDLIEEGSINVVERLAAY